jgi:ribosomal protein L37E
MPTCAKCGSDRVKPVAQSDTKLSLVFLRCAACGFTSATKADSKNGRRER